MGRPVNKRYFGNPATNDEAVYVYADIGNGVEQCFFVSQRSTRIFRVESVETGTQAEVQLVNGPAEVTGSGYGYLEAGASGGNYEAETAEPVAIGASYDIDDTVTLTGGTGTQAVLTVTAVQPVDNQDETSFNNTGANGTFVGGDGAGGTAYVAADTITLSDGTVVTVDAVDGDDDVTQFTVDSTNSTGVTTSGATLTQASTSGSGTGFTLTLGVANQGVYAVDVTTQGSYSAVPSNPVSQGSTTGSGSSATFNITTSSVTDEFVYKWSNKNLITWETNSTREPWDPTDDGFIEK